MPGYQWATVTGRVPKKDKYTSCKINFSKNHQWLNSNLLYTSIYYILTVKMLNILTVKYYNSSSYRIIKVACNSS